jgi:MscS family membrane protein
MLVTVPNKKMIEAELINETERVVRRSAFTLNLSHDTSEDQLKKILMDIRSLLSDHQMLEHGNETVRFRQIGNSGLEIFITFIVLTPDMNEFLGIQEEINFQIIRIVKNNHSSFAAPAVTKIELSESKSQIGNFKTLSQGQ